MKFFRIINKVFTFLYFLIKFKHFKTAFLFSHYQVPFSSSATLARKGNEIEFLLTRNSIPLDQLEIFKERLVTLIKVLNSKDAKIEKILPLGFVMSFKGVVFKVLSVFNIATAKEVFIENIYNIKLPANHAVILDIGLNVGYASLYFSQMNEIDHIYSFEPFEGTFQEARENINLNIAARNKITIKNQGVSNYNGSIKVPLLESGSAVGSTNQKFIENNLSNIKGGQFTEVQVQIVDIKDVLNDIIAENLGQPIYIKLDCEGEEYQIMSSIEENGLLASISGFIIEWHLRGPDPLISILSKNNYTMLHFPRHIDIGIKEAETGMIYAFK
jgi:FkbM family methyltransferase